MISVKLVATVFALVSALGSLDALAFTNIQSMMIQRLLSISNAGTGSLQGAKACFDQYLPILEEIQSNFQNDYQKCLVSAAQQTTTLTGEATANKTTFVQQTHQLCSGFQACASGANILNFFNCYANVAHSNALTLYGVEVSATADATELLMQTQLIREKQDLCTNATENAYAKETAWAYDRLDACLGTDVVATPPSPILDIFDQLNTFENRKKKCK